MYLYVWSDNFLYLRVCKVNPNKPKQKKERNSRHAFSLINPNPMSDSEPRRRRRKPKSLSERVPYDVVIDILSRLPVKSLIRFRRVSKSWYSVITDPFFINKHFNLNLNLNKAKSLSNKQWERTAYGCLQ